MAGFYSPFASQALSANGDNSGIGYVDVPDATQFEVGATVSLAGTTVAAAMYQVAAVDTVAGRIGVRILYTGTPRLNGQNYGLTSVSQYTTADSARVVQNVQFIYAESGTAEADAGFSIGAFGGTSANGLAFTSGELSLTAANATNPGGMSTGTQTFSGNKTFNGTIAASNLSGTNTGDFTLTAVGAAPNANGATRTNQALNLEPADATHPGILTAIAQVIGGTKSFVNDVLPSSDEGANLGSGAHRWAYAFMDGWKDQAGNIRVGAGTGSNNSYLDNIASPGASDACHSFNTRGAPVAGGVLLEVKKQGARQMSVSKDGAYGATYTDSSGTPGNATANTVSGRAAIANGAQAAVITNSVVGAASIIKCQLETPGAGVANVLVTAHTVGSFTVKSVNGTGALTNTTADATFSWYVFNAA